MAEEIKVATAVVNEEGKVETESHTEKVETPKDSVPFVTGTCTEEEAKQPAPEATVTTTEAPAKPVMSKEDIKSFEAAKNGLLNSIKDMVPPGLLQKEKLTDEDKQQLRNSVESYLAKQYLKRYSLDKLDLEKEYEKIKVKNSGLSRSQRDAVVGYFLIFKWGPVVQQKIKELKEKENRTPEEEQLLQTILGTHELSEAYQTVKKAEEKLPDPPAEIKVEQEAKPEESAPAETTEEPKNE